MADERYCVNCRAELPRGTATCEKCGVYAGDVFDGRNPARRGSYTWILALLVILAVVGAAIWLQSERKRRVVDMPIGVVSDRPAGARRAPGAKLSEPEAIRALRRHLTNESLRSECLVISSQGWREGAYALTALDRCNGTRLGRWRVDANSGAVSAATASQTQRP